MKTIFKKIFNSINNKVTEFLIQRYINWRFKNETVRIFFKKYLTIFPVRLKPTILIEYYADRNLSLLMVVGLYIGMYSLCLFTNFPNVIADATIELVPYSPSVLSDRMNSTNEIFGAAFSITMVIIGFIFTELKRKNLITFDFLARATFVYSIFYASILNICSLLILSNYEEVICGSKNETCTVLTNLYSITLGFIIFNLVQIGYLFRVVMRLMDTKEVLLDYRNYLIGVSRSILKNEIIVKFKTVYSNEINPDGIDFGKTKLLPPSIKTGLMDEFGKSLLELNIEIGNAIKDENLMNLSQLAASLKSSVSEVF